MTWVRLEEAMPEHPKVAQLSDAAFRVHIEGLCYSNRNLTDGFVPTLIGHQRGKRRAIELVTAGVWDQVPGGYQIHDFHDFQPSKAEVLELREKRTEAGRRGAQARWQTDGKSHGKSHSKSHGKWSGKTMPRTRTPIDEEVKTTSSSPHDGKPHGTELAVPIRRNDQWDGLEAVFGYRPKGTEATLWGKLCRQLGEFDATKPSIEEAARRFHIDMPGVSFTPTGLVKHYQRLMATNGSRNGAKPGTAEHTLELARQARQREHHAGI